MIGAKTAKNRLAAALLAGVCVVALGSAQPGFAAAGGKSESEVFLQDAQNYMKKGDVNAAVIQLKNALQADPNYVPARKMLGDLYLRSGNGPAAEKEFKAAQRGGGADHELAVMLAKAYLAQGKFDAVLSELKDDSSDPKVRLEVLLVRARAELGLAKIDQASAIFAEAEKLDPKDPRAKVGIAQVLANKGNIKEGEAKIDEALAIDPNHSDSLMLKGELRRLNRDLDGALAAFDRAIKANSVNISARLGRAAALIDLNKDEAAQAELQFVFQRVPKHPLASYLSALVLSKKKDFVGAQESLQQASAVLDNHMPSVFLSGAIHYALNQLEQADQSLTRYVAAVPNNERARKLLGATLVRKGDAQRALEVLKPLAEARQKDPQVLALLGSANMRLGNYAEGSDLFEQAAEISPDAANIRTQLALSRLAQGQSDAAVGDLEKAVGLDADAHQAGILLTLVRLRKNEFDAAIEAAQKLEKSMPENPLPYNLLGAAYLGKGDMAGAERSFEQALKIKSDFHPARMNLAQLALRQNKIDVASTQLETIVKENPRHIAAMMALADIAAQQGKDDAVLSWLQKASDANPQSVAPKLKLVQYYSQNKDPRRALAVARELDSSAPNNPQVLEALGRAEAAAGDRLASVSTLRRLVETNPKDPRYLTMLAAAQVGANDSPGGRASYQKAIDIDANYAPAYLALAEIASKEGKTEEALKLAATLREKQPKDPVGDMLTGDIYMRASQFDKALASYDEGLKKQDAGLLAIRRFNAERELGRTDAALAWLQAWVDRKDDSGVRHLLASNYIAAKKYDPAIRESERLLEKEQNNTVLLNNLAWLYDQKGDQRAVEFAERAYKQAPKAAAVIDTLGWILARRGDKERAAELLRQAHDLAPKQGDIAYHFAVALKNTGKDREAQRVLQRALEANAAFPEAEEARKLLKELGG